MKPDLPLSLAYVSKQKNTKYTYGSFSQHNTNPLKVLTNFTITQMSKGLCDANFSLLHLFLLLTTDFFKVLKTVFKRFKIFWMVFIMKGK